MPEKHDLAADNLVARLQELLAAVPFAPFTVRLRGGEKFRAEQPFSVDITEGQLRLAAHPGRRIWPCDIASIDPTGGGKDGK